jgi:hypothetical protein
MHMVHASKVSKPFVCSNSKCVFVISRKTMKGSELLLLLFPNHHSHKIILWAFKLETPHGYPDSYQYYFLMIIDVQLRTTCMYQDEYTINLSITFWNERLMDIDGNQAPSIILYYYFFWLGKEFLEVDGIFLNLKENRWKNSLSM